MDGVVLWADHIQAIHSHRSILRSTKLLRQPGKKLLIDEILADEKSMFLQDEGVDCSADCMRAFVWAFGGSQSSQWRFPPALRGIISSTVFLLKD